MNAQIDILKNRRRIVSDAGIFKEDERESLIFDGSA
jgi:hypothetical protein